jgi:hypothetical protein
MSNHNRPPSPPRQCRDRDGYRCCFYGGWLRKATVKRNGTDIVIYEQDPKDPFVLPPGADRPFTTSQIEFRGDGVVPISITLDDPGHVVDRIEVVLKKKTEGGVADGNGDGDGDRLILENTPMICPPHC